MAKLKYLLILLCLPAFFVASQNLKQEQYVETQWDQGIPVYPDDSYIQGLISKINPIILQDNTVSVSKQDAIICRELAIAFYNRGMYDAADWYLDRAKGYVEVIEIQPETIVKQVVVNKPISNATEEQLESLQNDVKFLESIPDSYDQMNSNQLKQLAKRINDQIAKLIKERDQLIQNKASQDVINAKDKSLQHLEKEKHVIDLTLKEDQLKSETGKLKYERQTLYRYLIIAAIVISILVLLTSYIALRRRVVYKETVIAKQKVELRNRMNAINESNAVIEFDLDGNIVFANKLFIDTMGYSSELEIIGKHHKIFVEDDYAKSEDYVNFWKKLRSGTFFSGEFIRVRKDGSLIYLQATYNPILDTENRVHRIMKIATDITTTINQQREIEKQNTYLEHAAKILRHDMHSGINTYIPRGLSSLERRLDPESIRKLKLEAPLKMIREGLTHTQKVYKGVYEFTNLVKKDVILNKTQCDLKQILEGYLNSTSYKSQVILEDLGTGNVNEALFCTAVDNLIRNGLKYNDSPTKFVKIFIENGNVAIQDNGRGLTQEEFNHLSKPYTRKPGQKETGTGLGLNICVAILTEHGFKISCEKNEIGTKITINMGI